VSLDGYIVKYPGPVVLVAVTFITIAVALAGILSNCPPGPDPETFTFMLWPGASGPLFGVVPSLH
jgi:hypothetical protein